MEHMKFESPDLVAGNVEKIAELFPNCVTETRGADGKLKKAINFEMLRQMLSADVVEGDEAYEFTWVGKKASIVEANRPIRKTLRPCPEESVDWDTTENLYIEGDNLEVLKLLQESYLGKVKMIYIDPPYNTGNDFIYRDDFKMDSDEYEEQLGMFDEETGERLFKNTDSNGRFHSDWCSMIYPRLVVARNMLTPDGIIFISIDDAEVENLRKIADEVFGEHNFVACLVYDKNRKNDAKYFSVGHEYMLVYFKSIATVKEMGTILRAPKEGVDEVKKEFARLRKLYDDDWEKVNEGLKKLYASWDEEDDRRLISRFSKVDEKGPYRDDGNINWPGGGGPMYDVIHPSTGKVCKKPISGWRYPTPERLQEEIDKGHVVFGKDETTVPRVRMNLFEQDKQVMRSVMFSYAQTATQEFNNLFDDVKVFENPKATSDLQKLIEYYTSDDKDAIIMDFFSGSATTAHAVMQVNSEDRGNRKYILVQLPEIIDPEKAGSEKSRKVAQNAVNLLDSIGKPHTICEIGKERIRRAAAKIKQDSPLTTQDLDVGFRVFKLDSTNMEDVRFSADEYGQAMLEHMVSNIRPDRTDLDLLFGCLLEWGLPLSLPYTSEELDGCTVHTYNDGDLIACFNEDIPESVIKAIAKRQPLRAVFRDSSFASSPAKINVEEIFKMLAPDTRVKVI